MISILLYHLYRSIGIPLNLKPSTCYHDYIPLDPRSARRLPEVSDTTIQATDHGCGNARLVADEALGIPWKGRNNHGGPSPYIPAEKKLMHVQWGMGSILKFDEVWQERVGQKWAAWTIYMTYIHVFLLRQWGSECAIRLNPWGLLRVINCLTSSCQPHQMRHTVVKLQSSMGFAYSRSVTKRDGDRGFRSSAPPHCTHVQKYKRNKTWLGPKVKENIAFKIDSTRFKLQKRQPTTNVHHRLQAFNIKESNPHQPTPEPSIVCKTTYKCKPPRKRCPNPTFPHRPPTTVLKSIGLVCVHPANWHLYSFPQSMAKMHMSNLTSSNHWELIGLKPSWWWAGQIAMIRGRRGEARGTKL